MRLLFRQIYDFADTLGDCALGDDSSGAVFDAASKYRYLLWRRLNDVGEDLCFVMLNPSKADHIENDPTIARCLSFAKEWRCKYVQVVNLFAYRATDSKRLYKVRDPIGPHNNDYILRTAGESSLIVVAWGNHGGLYERHAHVAEMVASAGSVKCFGWTGRGQPKHPLYLRKDAPLYKFAGSSDKTCS